MGLVFCFLRLLRMRIESRPRSSHFLFSDLTTYGAISTPHVLRRKHAARPVSRLPRAYTDSYLGYTDRDNLL